MQIIALCFIQFFDSSKGLNVFQSFKCIDRTPSSIQTHTHFLISFYSLIIFSSVCFMLKLHFSCFVVHSQHNVIIIAYIGEDLLNWKNLCLILYQIKYLLTKPEWRNLSKGPSWSWSYGSCICGNLSRAWLSYLYSLSYLL
jgi:hypothetical protein